MNSSRRDRTVRRSYRRKGGAQVRRAISGLVANLPNSPMMIEGYSAHGPREERYIRSRQRADAVRRYLETEFQLNPKLIGVMPLADSPPASSGKRVWDGVSVVMLH